MLQPVGNLLGEHRLRSVDYCLVVQMLKPAEELDNYMMKLAAMLDNLTLRAVVMLIQMTLPADWMCELIVRPVDWLGTQKLRLVGYVDKQMMSLGNYLLSLNTMSDILTLMALEMLTQPIVSADWLCNLMMKPVDWFGSQKLKPVEGLGSYMLRLADLVDTLTLIQILQRAGYLDNYMC